MNTKYNEKWLNGVERKHEAKKRKPILIYNALREFNLFIVSMFKVVIFPIIEIKILKAFECFYEGRRQRR